MNFENIFQESEMTQEEKMDAWHNGSRGFNIKAASTSKLRANLAICKRKKYKSEVAAIEAEIKSRGLKIKESVEEQPETEETFKNPLWKVEAIGEDEVRELFNNIRNGSNNIDKQFVEKVYEIFPDMPTAVKILHGDIVDDSDDWEAFSDEELDIFDGNTVYYENERSYGVCEHRELWDFIGDGKNPFDIYIATYSQSDGMENTVVLYYGDDWYMVCPWDNEKIKIAIMDNLLDVEGGEKILKSCYRKEYNQNFTLSNKSLI